MFAFYTFTNDGINYMSPAEEILYSIGTSYINKRIEPYNNYITVLIIFLVLICISIFILKIKNKKQNKYLLIIFI